MGAHLAGSQGRPRAGAHPQLKCQCRPRGVPGQGTRSQPSEDGSVPSCPRPPTIWLAWLGAEGRPGSQRGPSPLAGGLRRPARAPLLTLGPDSSQTCQGWAPPYRQVSRSQVGRQADGSSSTFHCCSDTCHLVATPFHSPSHPPWPHRGREASVHHTAEPFPLACWDLRPSSPPAVWTV